MCDSSVTTAAARLGSAQPAGACIESDFTVFAAAIVAIASCKVKETTAQSVVSFFSRVNSKAYCCPVV